MGLVITVSAGVLGIVCARLLQFEQAIILCAVPALVWYFAPRWAAYAVWVGYMLALSAGLPAGYSAYTGQPLSLGIALWLGASALAILPWIALWGRRHRLSRLILALTLTLAPPIGAFGWGHPLYALAAVIPAPSATDARAQIEPIDTDWGRLYTQRPSDQLERNYTLQREIRRSEADTILLPEGVMGVWTEMNAMQWSMAMDGSEKVVYGGAQDLDGQNVIIRADADGARVVYRQQIGVPLINDNPFARPPEWPEHDQPFALLICYEQLILWPVITQAGRGGLLAVADVSWAPPGSSIPAYLNTFRRAGARLIGAFDFAAANGRND